MEGTELSHLLTGAGGLNGYRLRSQAIMKMFKTNEYAFQASKLMIDVLKYDNLRINQKSELRIRCEEIQALDSDIDEAEIEKEEEENL